MRKYGLKAEHLLSKDKARLVDDMQAQADEACAGLADIAKANVLGDSNTTI